MTHPRRRLLDDLASNASLIAGLEHDRAHIVASAESSNSDDEHDPEGATIAFERQQVTALLNQARRKRQDLEFSLAQLEGGTYGECEKCGGAIPSERMEARPSARTCLTCAN